MEKATAKVTFVRIAPRKVKIVLDLIRGKSVEEAEAILKYTPKAACEVVSKLLKSAVANAEDKNIATDNLFVSMCKVDQGPTLKRMRPRAQGRGFRINKKTSHITLELSAKGEEE